MEPEITSLLDESQRCTHKPARGPYASPAFMSNSSRLLTTADIPIQSYGLQVAPKGDPGRVPWNDHIKNFVADMSAFSRSRKLFVCVTLAGTGYPYVNTSVNLALDKYCASGGVSICVVPSEKEEGCFDVRVVKREQVFDTGIDTTLVVPSNALVTVLLSWDWKGTTGVLCHDMSTPEYVDYINASDNCTWSVPCTITSFVESDITDEPLKYMLLVYGHAGSTETRAVGRGKVVISQLPAPALHVGRVNYYMRCVRGSPQPSGRCYDCEMLWRTVARSHAVPEVSPVVKSRTVFTDSFLRAARESVAEPSTK